MRYPFQQCVVQLVLIDRFGQVVVHAGLQAGFAVAGAGVGGHGHDGQVGVAGLFADFTGGSQTVHFRHLYIHQDQVVAGAV